MPINSPDITVTKQIKLETNEVNIQAKIESEPPKVNENEMQLPTSTTNIVLENEGISQVIGNELVIPKTEDNQITEEPNLIPEHESPSRRGSQESATTSTTATTTTNSSGTTSSSSSSSGSSSSESSSSDDSDSSSDEDNVEKKSAKKLKSNNELISEEDTNAIYKACIKNLEECVTRFPEHYKAMYRLIYHYLNAPDITKSIEKCKELLLGSYKTTLGNQIGGLFNERKNNNFFNVNKFLII